MPIAWTESETLKLISLYRQYGCLRNHFHCDFKNKLCRYKAYKEIVDSMRIPALTISDCIKRITYMKTQYCYELSKISAAISCEKFYQPKAKWFPIMHDLLFPFVQNYDCTDDSSKVPNKKEFITSKYCDSIEAGDRTRISYYPQSEQTWNNACSFPYPNCGYKKLHKQKSYIRNKNSWSQSINEDDTCQIETSNSKKKIPVNIGKNTKNATVQNEVQTNVSCVKSEHRILETGIENNRPSNDLDTKCTRNIDFLETQTKKDPESSRPVDNITAIGRSGGRRKRRDEFDMFGKSIAFQLRTINPQSAMELEKRIQELITKKRLSSTKSKQTADCTCSCSDCKITHKETTCSCGLSVIMIKADEYCESFRK